jgi:hypothetical protein
MLRNLLNVPTARQLSTQQGCEAEGSLLNHRLGTSLVDRDRTVASELSHVSVIPTAILDNISSVIDAVLLNVSYATLNAATTFKTLGYYCLMPRTELSNLSFLSSNILGHLRELVRPSLEELGVVVISTPLRSNDFVTSAALIHTNCGVSSSL